MGILIFATFWLGVYTLTFQTSRVSTEQLVHTDDHAIATTTTSNTVGKGGIAKSLQRTFYPATITTGTFYSLVSSSSSKRPLFDIHEQHSAAEEDDSEEIEAHDAHGDTAIVQNNYNVKMNSSLHRLNTSDVFIYIVGSLILVVLLLGIIILGVILGRLLEQDDQQPKPVILMPPPGGNSHWRHDPIFEIPQSYTSNNGKFPSGGGDQYNDQPLHSPKTD